MALGQRGIGIARQMAGPGDIGGQAGPAELGVPVAADAVGERVGDRRAILVMFQPPRHGAEAAGHRAGIDDEQDRQAEAAGECRSRRFGIVKPHHALDEDQVGLPRGASETPARVLFAAHAQVDVLARLARGQRVNLRVEEVGTALEDAHLAAEARVQARQRRDHRGLAVARGRRGNEQGRLGYHSIPGIAWMPAWKACFTSVISVTVSAAATSSGGAPRPVTIRCCSGRTPAKCGEDLGQVEPAVLERVGEFVEDHEIDGRVGERTLRLFPRSLSGGGILRGILRLPGEAFAHHVPSHVRLPAEEGFLAGVGTALDELDHDGGEAVAERARQHAEGGRGLALAVASVDQEDAARRPGSADFRVDDFLLAPHAGGMAFGCFAHGRSSCTVWRSCSSPFSKSGPGWVNSGPSSGRMGMPGMAIATVQASSRRFFSAKR